jgi:hypothetical protein
MLVLAVVAVRFWWGWRARSDLDATVAALRAAGSPVALADLERSTTLADGENAAWHYRVAGSLLEQAPKPDVYIEWPGEYPLTSEELASVGTVRSAAASAWGHMRQARSLKAVDWGARLQQPIARVTLPHLQTAAELALASGSVVLWEHQDGVDAAAVERLRDMLALGDWVAAGPRLESHRLRCGISDLVCDRIAQIAPDLGISPGASATQPAAAESVRSLIGSLLDQRALDRGLRDAVRVERAVSVDTAEWLAARHPLVAPMFLREATRTADIWDVAESACQLDNWRAASGKLHGRRQSPGTSPPAGAAAAQALSGIMSWPDADGTIKSHVRTVAYRRMAAIILAIRLYRLDHGDQFPPNLSALVPDYLPVLPLDPFASGTAAVKYRGPPTTRPMLYCVGENGVDDGGERTPAGATTLTATSSYSDAAYVLARRFDWRWYGQDAVVDLERQPRAPPLRIDELEWTLPTSRPTGDR